MIQLQRILAPTDFSENSKAALDYALSLAKLFDAELHLIHVVQDMVLTNLNGTAFLQPASNSDEAVASASQALEHWGSDLLAAAGPEVSGKVVRVTRAGRPISEIITYAKENSIDMLVLTTHGRTGLAHVLLGSVAENIVRHAPCPVLTIHPAAHKFVHP